MRWQKRAQLAIALFVIGFIVVVVLAVRRPQPPPADDGFQITDKDVVAQTTGGLVIEYATAGKLRFKLRADTQSVYPDGRSVYTMATIELPDREGGTVTIHGDEVDVMIEPGDQGDRLRSTVFKGNVRLLTGDGLELRSEEATYSATEGLLTIPGAVAFTRGRMSGTGVGATYDQSRDVVWLLDQARIVVTPDAAGEGELESTSGAAGLARGDHYAVLTRGARILASGYDLQADDITIRMTPDNERLEALELRVDSRITGGTGAADTMSARDIDLRYAEDGRTLRQATLVDNAVVQLPANGGAGGRRVAGRTIDIGMSPDGATVTSLLASGAVQVDLPPDPGGAARRIRANALEASGPAGVGLQAATFTGTVEYRETRGADPAIDRTARAERLLLQTAPGLGAIQQADFRGRVHITDAPDLVARAPRIVYQVDADTLDLSPGEGEAGPEPEVTEGRASVKARTIEVALATRGMKADTQVRSTLQPRRRPAAQNDPPDAGRVPSMLSADEPVFVTANRLEYDGAASQATYSGSATLWQDETRIQADVLVLDDEKGNLTGRTNVRTLMHMTEVDPKTKAKRITATHGQSQVFEYEEAARMATYTTGARIVGAQGDLTADTIELFLAKDANDLERAEAYGAVTVKEGLRTARGTRLTYTAADDRYVITGTVGTPVTVVDDKPSGCEKTVGSKLTFLRADDHFTMTTPTTQACGPGDRR